MNPNDHYKNRVANFLGNLVLQGIETDLIIESLRAEVARLKEPAEHAPDVQLES